MLQKFSLGFIKGAFYSNLDSLQNHIFQQNGQKLIIFINHIRLILQIQIFYHFIFIVLIDNVYFQNVIVLFYN